MIDLDGEFLVMPLSLFLYLQLPQLANVFYQNIFIFLTASFQGVTSTLPCFRLWFIKFEEIRAE
jgi:hypothetical protein